MGQKGKKIQKANGLSKKHPFYRHNLDRIFIVVEKILETILSELVFKSSQF